MNTKILIIEKSDNKTLLHKLLVPYLTRENIETETVKSHNEIPHDANHSVFVSINIEISEMEKIRVGFPGIPLIFVTDTPTIDGAYLCICNGVKEYIITPFKFMEMSKNIKKIIENI